jgi:hypothetical protein
MDATRYRFAPRRCEACAFDIGGQLLDTDLRRDTHVGASNQPTVTLCATFRQCRRRRFAIASSARTDRVAAAIERQCRRRRFDIAACLRATPT